MLIVVVDFVPFCMTTRGTEVCRLVILDLEKKNRVHLLASVIWRSKAALLFLFFCF